MNSQVKNRQPGYSAQQGQISGLWVNFRPIPQGEDGLDRGYGLDKRDAQLLMEHKLELKPRQIRAAVSSYSAELWAYHGPDGVLFGVSSLDARMLEHVDRRDDARRENGTRGGRPWTRRPGTTLLTSDQLVETVVVLG